MIIKKCSGCGITLQTEFPEKAGYVSEEKFITGTNILCQRCYKIKHYGKHQDIELTKEDYKKEVEDAVKKSDIILAIFDIIDFEGSFSEEILDFLREHNSIIMVNKIDLLPKTIHPSEISNWVKGRLEEEGIVPYDIALMSTKTKYGVNGVLRKIKSFKENATAVVLGVTNTGKSSFLNSLMEKDKSTISKYPGTTLKAIKNKIDGTDITIVDTPGLIPEKRISDLIDPKEALALVPNNEINRKTFKLDNNQVFLFDGLMWFRVIKEEDEQNPIFSAFAAKDVKFHVTKEDRVQDLLNKDFFAFPSKEEKDGYYSNMKKELVTVEAFEEMAISGLGWINVKRGPLTVELSYPENVKIVIRNGIINPKIRRNNEKIKKEND
ncbi:ribosome biogenesis GTPase YqeH [Sebaldella sp. S0638]|uniref:ribosome biogenesis GTPase YqeH n=1 Tax=Sebaldella sp. S0638 TaxID=2957809 RepID=UPI00209F8B53|nr:ribosome biogenesis GTPase YqeH [Sebaldella sp. S0638]MCP1224693.1 ribosome biogenesis GTPase YqeH [Sebaldella sp. S0638]